MAKSPRRKRSLVSGYTYKRGRKKITVQPYYRYAVIQPTRKTRPHKEVKPSKAPGYDRKSKDKGSRATGRRSVERKKLVQKDTYTSKVSLPSKGKPRGKGRSKAKRPLPQTSVAVRHSRKEHKIELVFKGVKSVARKASAIKTNKAFERKLALQLERKEGRPPMGFLVLLSDKHGNTAAKVSPPDMVVNQANIEKVIQERMKELEDSYDPEIADAMDNGEGGDTEGYEDYNPEDITDITIEFFYGK